jgi:hypothetical protein
VEGTALNPDHRSAPRAAIPNFLARRTPHDRRFGVSSHQPAGSCCRAHN